MQRKTASTVEGCSYSFLCVANGRPSRYSSAWLEDEADMVAEVEKSGFGYRRIIMFVECSRKIRLRGERLSRLQSRESEVASPQRK